MAKIQQCRNGCGKLIVVQLDNDKYKPFEVDLGGNPTGLHNCPNSMYNKQQQQGQVTQGFNKSNSLSLEQQQPINTPTLETHLLNQLSQKIEELQKQLNELKYFTEQQIHVFLTAHLGETLEVSKNSNLMLDAIVAHFKLTEPKKASELYTKEDEEKLEQEGI